MQQTTQDIKKIMINMRWQLKKLEVGIEETHQKAERNSILIHTSSELERNSMLRGGWAEKNANEGYKRVANRERFWKDTKIQIKS